MILYRGSYIEVKKPDLNYSRNNLDFGRGFYTTPIYEQAVKWCGRIKKKNGEAIVSQYLFDEKAIDGLIDKNEALKRLKYEEPNLQICFRSENALRHLVYERSESV